MILSDRGGAKPISLMLVNGQHALPAGILRVATMLRTICPPNSKGAVIMVTPVNAGAQGALIARHLGRALELLNESPTLVVDSRLAESSAEAEEDVPVVSYDFAEGEKPSIQSLALALREKPGNDLILARINSRGLLAAQIFSSPRFSGFLEEARNRFRYILLEGACLRTSEESLVLSQQADGVVLVVSAGQSKVEEVRAARDSVARAGGKVLGFVWDHLGKA